MIRAMNSGDQHAAGIRPRPLVLCVLDGWGWRENASDNAIAAARTPHYDRLVAGCPRSLLETSGRMVGLPDAQMGNSEVGHMNLGAGRIVLQDLPRIDAAIESGALADNPVLLRLIEALKSSGGTCHLMGLVSPGGVHSHQDHIAALARAITARGVAVRVHAFLDGRDTPPQSARDYLAALARDLAPLSGAEIVTVMGRYYAMDRDRRWERTERAYRCLVAGEGRRADDPVAAVAESYEAGLNDEFVEPVAIGDYAGMADGDGLLMANFRADRVRQILAALVDPDFDGFARAHRIVFAARVGMAEYSEHLNQWMETLFPKERITNTLGEVIAGAGWRQLRIAETEKYAHVTFFFNGGEETAFDGEDRVLIPSPKVATYDLKPEMSAPEVTDRLVEEIAGGTYDFILVNYANADMVGHTGILEAAVAAVEAVDHCLGRLMAALEAVGGALLLTADHGNVELMRDAGSGQPHTAHTTCPVPLILYAAPDHRPAALANGRLADVAPTILDLMGLTRPPEMTGRSLIAAGADADTGAAAEAARGSLAAG